MNITVNRLPDLTWNRLGMNYGVIRDADNLLRQAAGIDTAQEGLEAGVSHRRIGRDEAQRILDAAPEQVPEKIVAGKLPIYHAQRFATGLGGDYDGFVAGLGLDTELLEVAAGARPEAPVLWHVDFYDSSCAVTQQLIHVGKNASLTLIMDYSSAPEAGGFTGISTKVILEDGARLHLSKVQMLGQGYLHADDLGASLGTGAELIFNQLERGRKTESDMSFDGVLYDSARKIWRGTIDFRNGSAGSVGHENENVLMLSEDAENKSMPLILCEEEDVEGQHGSSIGRLADDILFYFGTRGIDERAAEEMMVDARIGTVTREIPDSAVQERIGSFLQRTV